MDNVYGKAFETKFGVDNGVQLLYLNQRRVYIRRNTSKDLGQLHFLELTVFYLPSFKVSDRAMRGGHLGVWPSMFVDLDRDSCLD